MGQRATHRHVLRRRGGLPKITPRALALLVVLTAPPSAYTQPQQCDIPDINECLSNPCDNFATCIESNNDSSIPHLAYRCICQPGYANGTCANPPQWLQQIPQYAGACQVATGGNCDLDLNECMRDPCQLSCQAHGLCKCVETDPILNAGHAYYCDFETGTAADPCQSSPCVNGGACSLAAPGDGRYQWLLQCFAGKQAVVNFSTSLSHKEIIVYDGPTDSDNDRLLSCGGYCSGHGQNTCENVTKCSSAVSSGGQLTVTFASPPADTDDLTSWVSVAFACTENITGSNGRRLAEAHELASADDAINEADEPRRRRAQSSHYLPCTPGDSETTREYSAPCDDNHPANFSGICRNSVCVPESWPMDRNTQCTAFVNHHDHLVTMADAKAACISHEDCGGVSDLYCHSTYPGGSINRYALCAGLRMITGPNLGCVYKPWSRTPQLFHYRHGHVTPVVTETHTSEFGTTFLLTIELSSAEESLYAVYASPITPPMVFPAAYNSALASSGGNIGVPPIILPEDTYDSWLTVGNVLQGTGNLGMIGINTSKWSTDGLMVTNGAMFLMDPDDANPGTALIAQVTGNYGCGESVVVNVQGDSADGGTDWETQGVTFQLGCRGRYSAYCTTDGYSDYCRHGGVCHAEDYESFSCLCSEGYASSDCSYHLITISDGGQFQMAVSNNSQEAIPRDAYVCSCAPGYANGICDYSYIPEYDSECNVLWGSNCDVDVNECVSFPCANNATCLESSNDTTIPPDQYSCGCPAGLAGGYCSTTLSEYQSQCSVIGGNCNIDIDECISFPCQNGAACSDSSRAPQDIPLDAYRCSCASGFVGGFCDFSRFSNFNYYSNYSQLCSMLTGGNCDIDVDECMSSPCQNGGTCTESIVDSFVPADSYHCECTADWSTVANTDCVDCHIGKYFASGVRRVGRCVDCIPGRYSDVAGAVTCANCAAGRHVSASGSDSSGNCTNCLAGQFSREGAGQCTPCRAGQYQNAQGMASCVTCAPGSVTDTLGMAGAQSCTTCAAGQYSTVSTTACATCDSGSVTDTLNSPGAVSCTACTAGLYSAVSTAACSTCAPGSVTDTLASDGASTCTECSIGRYSNDPTRGCAQCNAGAFAVRGSTSCTACGRRSCVFAPLGAQYMSDCSGPMWVANAVQSSCEACPAGTQPSPDRSRCDACLSGTASEDGVQCLMCNDTSVNHEQSSVANDARTSCIPCLPGTGANALASSCEPCPAHYYASCSGTGCMFCDPARGLIVTVDRTECYPSYQCPAATGCPVGQQCDSDRDCQSCSPGYVSAGGEPCRSCADQGPGWVSNSRQTDCMICHPGEAPTADRSACYACQGDYISILGSECQPCSSTRIANPTHTKCVDCNDGEVAANGVCACADGYYNSSNALIECGSLCDMNKDATDVTMRESSASVCSKCPSCVRCPVGANGLSSTPLVMPGHGLPKAYQGRSLAQLLSTDVISTTVTVYKCPRTEFCTGDHFVVDRRLIASKNVDAILETEWKIQSEYDLQIWHDQLVSLTAAAGVRIEATTALAQNTFGSSLEDLTTEQLKDVLRGYYSQLNANRFEPDLGDDFRVTYTKLWNTVVVPDSAIADVASLTTTDTAGQTNFSCAVGYNDTSPLCSLCEEHYAGGSTNTCKYCNVGTTGYRLITFIVIAGLVYAAGWLVFPKLINQYKSRMQARSQTGGSDNKRDFVLVGGANTQQASAFVYGKIVVSHFQVLLQFNIIMDIEWPEMFQALLDWVNIFKGDILNYFNLKCAVKLDLYREFTLAMLFAPICFFCALIFQAFRERRDRRRKSSAALDASVETSEPVEQPSSDSVVVTGAVSQALASHQETNGSGLLNNMFMLLFCIYPFLSTRICHVYSCVRLFPHGNEGIEIWQQYDYSVDCASPGYKTLQIVSVFMFITYPIGVPVFAMWVYHKNWSRLHGQHYAPVTREQFRSSNVATVQEMPWWYGDRSTFYFMVRDYRSDVFYFEIVEFVRKFALTGLLMIGAERGSTSQIVLGIIIAFAFGMLNAIVQPYADRRTNVFRILADVSLFITLLIVCVFHFEADFEIACEFLTKHKLTWILIGANFILLLVGANQEFFRRMLNLYNQAHLVGIMYDPNQKVLDGEGKYATIYTGQYRASASAHAVPAAVKVRLFDPLIESVETALQFQCDGHANIVKLFKTQRDGAKSYVAMERGDCSLEATLSGFSVGREKKELEPIATCKAITEGLLHMHKSGFVHGSVTPAHVMIYGTTPKLCGFSCARKMEATVATQMDTLRGVRGYQPLELLIHKHLVTTEVNNPEAVDVFGLGCTMFFVLSGGKQAFQASQGGSVELSIETGTNGIDLSIISLEAKHLLQQMLCPDPNARCSLESVLAHPLFWSTEEKLHYLESVANTLPSGISKSEHPFANALEALLDSNLGSYNTTAPERGGSWSRMLGTRYPLTGEWPQALKGGPQLQEHNYHLHGEPHPKPKEAGDALYEPKELRGVGLLKFIGNLYAHRVRQVEAGRFESVEAMCAYLMDPFPFLFAGVYDADSTYSQTNLVSRPNTGSLVRSSVAHDQPGIDQSDSGFQEDDIADGDDDAPQLDHVVSPLPA